MKKIMPAVIAGYLLMTAGLVLAAGKTPAPKPAGNCSACHRGVKETASIQHTFGDWEASVHGKQGLDCESCHGGDAARKDMEGAHAGLVPSTDPKSPVYFTNIPATCGKCHDAEYSAFKKSRHYSELERSGRGPNCVTCHGSMANHIMAPKDLETTCALCHRKPTRAFAAELALEESRAALRRLDAAIKKAGKGSKGLDAAKLAAEKARAQRESAVVQWHTFEMEPVEKTAKDSARLAEETLADLKAGK
jgi:formate-dependent nitrite reductase cytochrome c552 subunit